MDAELQTGSESEPEGGSGAEQAFEALRVEVASMRRQLELVHRQGARAGIFAT